MAGAATLTIAEVDEVVELGDLDPESIVTAARTCSAWSFAPSTPATSWQTPC